MQVEVGLFEVALLDTGCKAEPITSLRLSTSKVVLVCTTETAVVVPSAQASAIIAAAPDTRATLDARGNLSSQYWNSSLDVAEPLISVRPGHPYRRDARWAAALLLMHSNFEFAEHCHRRCNVKQRTALTHPCTINASIISSRARRCGHSRSSLTRYPRIK